MIKREVCPNCNGRLVPFGNGILKCECCHSVFDDVSITDEERSLLIAAAKLLRDGKFEEADEAYRDIVSSNPRNHEAYYGRALARHGIVFVSDIRAGAGKKVPTCYITDVGSFVDDVNYKKAVEFAPEDVKAEYVNQGNLIENIIVEWKEKASKEDYDVFISFKASEDETGEETKDSIEAAKLYSFLVSNNYKVFFAPVTLKAYTSERYEPYIFNALNQAPVMIVYGQSQEHMEATWVRNEWSRFIKKIQSGEKQPNSLVVIYEKMTSRDLPIEFRNIQCMDGNEHTCYVDLVKHINKVLEKSKKPVSSIDTIQTEYGKVGKKATKMDYKEIKTYTLGTATIEKITETDESILEAARKYFDHGMKEQCLANLDQFLAKNEYNFDANLMKLLVEHNCKRLETLIGKVATKEDINSLKFLITLASKKDALTIINGLMEKFRGFLSNNNPLWRDLFAFLVELDFPENQELRHLVIENMIDADDNARLFDEYICYINNEDVDYHLDARIRLLKNRINKPEFRDFCYKYVQEIRDIDEGNRIAIRYKLALDLGCDQYLDEIVKNAIYKQDIFIDALEELFKYSSKKDNDNLLSNYLNNLIEYIATSSNEEKDNKIKAVLPIKENEQLSVFEVEKSLFSFPIGAEEGQNLVNLNEYDIACSLMLFDKLIRYIPTNNTKEIVEYLDKLTQELYKKDLFDTCISYCNILLNYAPDDYKDDVIYLILLCKARISKNLKGSVSACEQPLTSFDEWNVLMNYKGTNVEADLFKLLKEQNGANELKKLNETNKEQAKVKLVEYKKKKRVLDRKVNSVSSLLNVLLIIANLLICGALFFGLYKFNIANENGVRILLNVLYPFTLIGFICISAWCWFFDDKPRRIYIVILGLGFVAGFITNIVMYKLPGSGMPISRVANLWLSTGYTVLIGVMLGSLTFKLSEEGSAISNIAKNRADGYGLVKSNLNRCEEKLKDYSSFEEKEKDLKKEVQKLVNRDSRVLTCKKLLEGNK